MEALIRVVLEIAQVDGQVDQDVLGHIPGIGVLQAPSQAPGVDFSPIVRDEFRPDSRIGGSLVDPAEQRRPGRGNSALLPFTPRQGKS